MGYRERLMQNRHELRCENDIRRSHPVARPARPPVLTVSRSVRLLSGTGQANGSGDGIMVEVPRKPDREPSMSEAKPPNHTVALRGVPRVIDLGSEIGRA